MTWDKGQTRKKKSSSQQMPQINGGWGGQKEERDCFYIANNFMRMMEQANGNKAAWRLSGGHCPFTGPGGTRERQEKGVRSVMWG